MIIRSFQELLTFFQTPHLNNNVIWLEGEEAFFIDEAIKIAENDWVPEQCRAYDLLVFYGKECTADDIITSCNRYPILHDFQVVIVKQINDLKDLQKLSYYISTPSPKTIFIATYINGKIDKRTQLGKWIHSNATYFFAKKLYDNEILSFINAIVNKKKLIIDNKAIELLYTHIGNNLSLINKELDKIIVNLEPNSVITTKEIEKYIGINREYNVYEFLEAIGRKDTVSIFKMLEYFDINPKNNSSIVVINRLFYYFKKLLLVHHNRHRNPKDIAKSIGVHPFFMNKYLLATKQYSLQSCHNIVNLIVDYHLKDLAIEKFVGTKYCLQKELVAKMLNEN